MTQGRSATRIIYDRVILRYPRGVLVCVAVIVGGLFLGAVHFRLDASAETLVLENDEDLQYSRTVNARYGQGDFLVVTFTPEQDLLSDGSLRAIRALRDELESVEGVDSVVSILDVPLLESPPLDIKELTGDLPRLESPSVDRRLARIELRNSPLYRDLLVSGDLRTTALMVNFAPDRTYYELLARRNELRHKKRDGTLTVPERSEFKKVAKEFRGYRDRARRLRHRQIMQIRDIMDRYRATAELFLGGVSMIADDMITFVRNDLKVFGLGVLVFLVVMLALFFGRKRWILLPMLCCAVSGGCMVGLLGWLGWEVTVISSNFISLQLIMTMAVAIHLIVRYRELLRQDGEAQNRALILDTICLMIRPCAYTVLTTIAGFGSLVFSDLLPVSTFGWMMVVGLVVSFLVTFLVFPVLLSFMPKETLGTASPWHISITSALARFTQRHGRAIILLSALLFAACIAGAARLDVENCFIDYFKAGTEIHEGMKVIDRQLGGTTPLDVIVRFGPSEERTEATEAATVGADSDFDEFGQFEEEASAEKYWFTEEKVRCIKAAHRYLEELPHTGKVLSPATAVSIAERLNNNEPLDSLELALLYNQTPEQFKRMLVRPYVSVEHDEVRFWVRVIDSDKTLRRGRLIERIKAELPGVLGFEPDQVRLTGMLVLYNNMLQSLFGSQILTLGLTVLALTVMFLVLFRSVRVALLAMLPNVLPVATVLGLMGWAGIPLDMMTMTIAAIGVGIAVDDTIHYIHRFKQEFAKDRDYLATMHRCHGSIGHAMYYTSATIVMGFSILCLSNFVPSVYFGLLTGVAMVIALLADLTVLPRLLILVKPFGKEGSAGTEGAPVS